MRYLSFAFVFLLTALSISAEAPDVQEKLRIATDEKAAPSERQAAINALRGARSEAAQLIPDLVRLMGHPDQRYVAWPARDALLSFGASSAKALCELLDDEASVNRQTDGTIDRRAAAARAEGAIWILWRLVGYGQLPAQEMSELLQSPKTLVRQRTAEIVRLAARQNPKLLAPAASALLDRLEKDANRDVRLKAAETLGIIGPHAAEHADRLFAMLLDENPEIQWATAKALPNMGPQVAPKLIGALQHQNPRVRRFAAFGLAKMADAFAQQKAPPASQESAISFLREAAPALIAKLKDSEASVRRNAADALGRLARLEAQLSPKEPAPVDMRGKLIHALCGALADDSLAVQVVAEQWLRIIAPNEPTVLNALAARKKSSPLLKKPEGEKSVGSQYKWQVNTAGLFPSSPVAGYPGVDGAKFTKWGWPEQLPYPGSVEHFRTMNQKYLPADPMHDATSLVKNFLAVELPGVDRTMCAEFEEPVYYIPMYGVAQPTGQKRPPVKVFKWRVGSKPLQIQVGSLKPSIYVARVIGAIRTEDVRPSPKPLIIRFRVNDQPDGTFSTATRRHRAIDNFYSIAEYYFRAYDDRPFTLEFALVEGTEVEVLLHNIDLHDHLAHLPREAAKKRPTLFTLEEREADRREFAAKIGDKEYAQAFRRSHGCEPPWKSHRPGALTPEERDRLDEELWEGLPPMNVQFNQHYGKMNHATPEEISNATAKGVTDPGWGVYFPETQNYWTPVADAVTNKRRAYMNELTPMDGDYPASPLVLRYHFAADAEAARDAAMRLIRIASLSPTWDMRQSIQNVVCTPEQCWGREQTLTRRVPRSWSYQPVKLMKVYDMLFDYIQGNEELTLAVRRFLPEIRTNHDLMRMLDTHIIQFAAHMVMRRQLYSDHETPQKMITAVTVQGDCDITRPWMEWLFSRTWDYPQPLAGIQDYMNTATTRDGTTYIGSWAYTATGGRGIDIAADLEKYLKHGGDPKYDLTDLRLYPKVITSCYWPIEGRVAGLHPLQVGDVGGVTISHGHWFDTGEKAIRLGWRWTRDPRFAWALKHFFGRKGESDEDWRRIEELASNTRNPWFANRSRVLSAWAGILESGIEHDDFRFRRALTLRVGNGYGHAHNDTLDLNLFAHGCIMAGDGGQRPGYGHPECFATFTHNTVEVDGDGHPRGTGNWYAHAWIRTIADAPGARFMLAQSIPPSTHPNVKLFLRHAALIDVDEGRPSPTPITPAMQAPGAELPKDVITPSSYVVDVFRVSGGKTHTYCFHGGQSDEVKHNAQNPLPLEKGGTEFEQQYLRKFDICPERRWVANGVEHLIADFRLSRDPMTFEHKGVTHRITGAEPQNLGRSFDPNSPRKFTRLHLLGQPKARVLGATWFNAPYTQDYRLMSCLDTVFVQRRDEVQELESVFVALIEPYAGEPFIANAKLLPVALEETDSTRPVAVEVQILPNEQVNRPARTDICFADCRPERIREIAGMRLSGEFAFISRDDLGLRQATLVGGTTIETPDLLLKLHIREYSAKALEVDYLDRVASLDAPLPPKLLDMDFVEVGNEHRHTSLETSSVEGKRLHFRKGVEILTARVISFDPKTGVLRAGLNIPVMGSERVEGERRIQDPLPGMDKGFTASNEGRSVFCRCDFLGGAREEGYEYRLYGRDLKAEDFPVGSAFRVYEFGPGDTIRRSAYASIRRVGDKLYELTANAPVTVGLKGNTFEMSHDQRSWKPLSAKTAATLTAAHIEETALGVGKIYLRVR